MAISQPGARELEFAFAAEAAAHTRSSAELNPYAEAEVLELGNARAVYSGAWSPVHGVSGLGLDGPVEERDLREVERFYHRKERSPAFWLCPDTDPSLPELLKSDYQLTRKCAVHGIPLSELTGLPEAAGNNKPELAAWSLAFTKALDPGAKESGLLALTKLHQADTRLYLGMNGASYTFFHLGIALVPAPSLPSLLALQASDAKTWGAAFLACVSPAKAASIPGAAHTSIPGAAHASTIPLPLRYERSLYERL